MKCIIVVSCSNKKKNYICSAEEMYSESVLFRKTIHYIKCFYALPYVILSSKYGIIKPENVIEPYDKYIKNCNEKELEFLNVNIYYHLSPFQKIIVYGGKEYVNLIKESVEENTIVIEPLKGLGIGRRLKYLGDLPC